MSAFGLFVALSAVVGGNIAMGAIETYQDSGYIEEIIQAHHGRPANLTEYAAFIATYAGPHYITEALTVLPPVYALLYYLGHVGHAKQTMLLAK